eukprot:1366453-Pleurochrysis_carterae.AAC.1
MLQGSSSLPQQRLPEHACGRMKTVSGNHTREKQAAHATTMSLRAVHFECGHSRHLLGGAAPPPAALLPLRCALRMASSSARRFASERAILRIDDILNSAQLCAHPPAPPLPSSLWPLRPPITDRVDFWLELNVMSSARDKWRESFCESWREKRRDALLA